MTEITRADMEAALRYFDGGKTYTPNMLAEDFARHREDEQKRIVEWLQRSALSPDTREYYAKAIEAGEHLK